MRSCWRSSSCSGMTTTIRIGLVGDRDDTVTAHRAILAALELTAAELEVRIEPTWLPTDRIMNDGSLDTYDALTTGRCVRSNWPTIRFLWLRCSSRNGQRWNSVFHRSWPHSCGAQSPDNFPRSP